MSDVATRQVSESAGGAVGIAGLIPDHRLLRRIGQGSYGEVWLARSVTGIWRAVKIVRRDAFAEERPFEREFEGIRTFQAVARGHEALINLLHVGRPEGGDFYYYVMELADDVERGSEVVPETYEPRTLAAELKLQSRLPCDRCLRLARELARALVHLHAAGLIHRDIKPSNIVAVNGTWRLADLGLVAEAGSSRSFVGTEGFVPSEGPGTPQADVYALGKVLYEALTGLDRKEFPRLPAEWNGWPDGRERQELNAIILQACDDAPQRRYRGAAELLEHLDLLQGGKSVRRLQHLERGWRWARIGLAVAILAAAVSWSGAVMFRQRAERERGLREMAEAARGEARAQLAVAVTARLRGAVSSTRAGERMTALELLRAQRGLEPTPELREALAGVLTRADFRREWSFPEQPHQNFRVMLDLPHDRWFEGPVDGCLVLKRFSDRSELARWKIPEGLGARWRATVSPDGGKVALTRVGKPLLIGELTAEPAWQRLGGVVATADEEPERITFTPDGTALLRAGEREGDYEVAPLREASVEKGRHLQLPAVGQPLFSPDGKVLACLDGRGGLVLCDAITGTVLTRGTPEGNPWCVAWSLCGGLLATGSSSGGVEIWEWRDGGLRRLRRLEGAPAQWLTVGFIGGSDLVMASGWSGWTCLWSVASGQLLSRDPTSGGEMTIAPTGEWVAHHEWTRQSVALYRIQPSTGLVSLSAGSERLVTAAFSPDGSRLVVGGDEGLEAWHRPWCAGQPAAARESAAAVRGARSLVFSQDGSEMAVMGVESEPVWRWAGGGWSLESIPPGPFAGMKDVAQTPDRRLAVGARGAAAIVLEKRGADWLQQTSLPFESADLDPSRDWIQIDVSPDGRWAAAGSFYTRRWWVWEIRSRRLVKRGDHSPGTVVGFSPDGRWLAIGEGARNLVLSTADWREAAVWPRPGGLQLRGFPVWRPDGARLAVPRGPHELTIREAGSWREIVTLATASGRTIREACFSPDGRYLAAPDSEGCVSLWDFAELEKAMREALGEGMINEK